MAEDEQDIYSDEGREESVENDEIEPWEAGFMEGAEGKGQMAECENCGKILMGPEDVVETEIDDDIVRFCSEECFQEYKKKH